jgi:hypothetical protein
MKTQTFKFRLGQKVLIKTSVHNLMELSIDCERAKQLKKAKDLKITEKSIDIADGQKYYILNNRNAVSEKYLKKFSK